MANPICTPRLNYKTNAVVHVLGVLCVSLLLQNSGAAEFAIGGSKGWSVPNDPSAIRYDQWAEGNRFQIGDSIVFNYPPGQDSVLRVSQEDYANCNTDSPTAEKFSDGHTVYKFGQSGPFYFISGNKDNCVKNEKVAVIVLADRSNQNANSTTPPSPAPEASPPSPPEAGTVEINPTPAPESSITPPPPSAASSVFISFVGSIGAFAASSSLLLF